MKNATEKLKGRTINEVTEDATDLERVQDFLFQFIDHETGYRSEPFISDYAQLNDIIRNREEGDKPHDNDYILLVAVLDKKQTHVPSTPLIHVSTFLDTMPEKIKD